MASTGHLKRHSMPNAWPVQRKTITFVSRPNPGSHKRDYVASALILLRDVLGYAHTTKEAKFIVNNQEVLVNGKKVTDIKTPVGLFDVFELPLVKEKFVMLFDTVGRVRLQATKDKNLTLKVSKKTKVKGGKFQLNAMNGFNVLVDEKTFNSVSVNDSIVYNVEKKAVEEVLALKEGNFVYIFDGKFQGQLGQIKSFIGYNGVTRDLVQLEVNGEEHQTAKDYAYVIGSKKTDMKRFA